MIAQDEASIDKLIALQQKLEARERILEEREFVLSQTQKIAKIGSWNFDRATRRTLWSDEMYSIHGLHNDFDTDDYVAVLHLYDESSRAIITEAGSSMYQTKKSFDVTARIVTPLGYKKWVRVVGHPVIKGDEVVGIMGLTYDISIAKEADELLRESEEKFASAFRNNPDLMVITREEDMLIMDVNEKVFPVLGYCRDEVVGKLSSEFNFYVNASDREKFKSEFLTMGQVAIECRWYKKNGEIVYVMINSNLLKVRGKNYVISVIKDISARKLAEEKFQKAFALSPDLMILVRMSDLCLIEANNKLEEISGYTYEETIGKSTQDFNLFTNPKHSERFFEQLKSGSASLESFCRKKNGELFYGAITSSLIELAGETHFICVIRDITSHMEAQNKIRENETNLNAIINNTDMDIWSIDTDLKIVALNENIRARMKRSVDADLHVGDDLIKSLQGKLPDDRLEQWIIFYDLALSGGSITFSQKVNDETFQYSLHPINNDNAIVGVAGYAKNITQIILAQEELDAADKRITELRLTTLRAFMNPHFIFNALNSIQFFIANNDRSKAITYLSTFSKLIRGVLANSQHTKINLEDELEMLKHYINLEQVRFKNRFDFELTVSSGLDISKLHVPSLIIQPFVENSILHGLTVLPHKGLLKVMVSKKQNYLLVEVEDNGIGRAASKAIRESSLLMHESIGVALTEERLRVINNNKEEVSVTYEDLYEGTKPRGTKVMIKVRIS